jgi:hypothetical protein
MRVKFLVFNKFIVAKLGINYMQNQNIMFIYWKYFVNGTKNFVGERF